MELYIIHYTDPFGYRSYVDTTNDVNKWLAENNKRRIDDGEEPEELDWFEIKEVTMEIKLEEN